MFIDIYMSKRIIYIERMIYIHVFMGLYVFIDVHVLISRSGRAQCIFKHSYVYTHTCTYQFVYRFMYHKTGCAECMYSHTYMNTHPNIIIHLYIYKCEYTYK